jgi:hypothetical protein
MRFGTNYPAHYGFRTLDNRIDALRMDLYISTATGERHREHRHTAGRGDMSAPYSGECMSSSCSWCYLNADHTTAAHERSMATSGQR